MTAEYDGILDSVANAFTLRLKQRGATPGGVFLNSLEGQQLRFELLLSLIDPQDFGRDGIGVNDLGTGYGALFDYILEFSGMRLGYFFGYDICRSMIRTSRSRIKDSRATFIISPRATHKADYSFVSGTYNMKNDADEETWKAYVKESLIDLWSMSKLGLAFNMLDISGRGRTSWLFYASSDEFVDFCVREMSTKVELVDSTPLKEWTILVRR